MCAISWHRRDPASSSAAPRVGYCLSRRQPSAALGRSDRRFACSACLRGSEIDLPSARKRPLGALGRPTDGALPHGREAARDAPGPLARLVGRRRLGKLEGGRRRRLGARGRCGARDRALAGLRLLG